MRKFKPTVLTIITALLFSLLAGCSSSTKTPTTAQATGGAHTEKAEKIASLSIHLTNDLLALGITPVGSVIGGKAKDFLAHVADRLHNTKKLGVAADPDMEALLALKPDMILVDEEFAGQDLDKYNKIAPTHMFSLDEGTWRDHLRALGQMLNREQQAESFIQEYEAQAERVKSLIKEKTGATTAMAIRVSAKELRVQGMKRPLGPLLFEDLELQPANGVEKIQKAYEVISQEVLADYDPDLIFVIVNVEEDAKKVFEQLQVNPLWLGLRAVKENHVYVINEQPWLDYSALGSKMALDEAEKLFAK
ncbi:iron-hydroxamate ABC transporter substrate-binding protein [Brevibacillus fulvus]|uniref:Iron complex transport system substrate-binding protein n=1 Tax=Brevibacillus fulvus TaxID=1125967 RepID=A0A939BSD6_9BACL|nr:iron-hydroxamate ABC transporter substrate-binding protein [Brevibacillus fulvus]MBM7590358.1 iron complex transport system substrate-binding protein [Brevibacillus fulvus]